MSLRPVLYNEKVILHLNKSLAGQSSGQAISVPNLSSNVKGLKLRVVVEGDKQDAFVFLGSGNSTDGQRYQLGARVASPGFGRIYENNGDVLLDGNRLWMQYNAMGGTVRYSVIIVGHFVEVPDTVDLSPITSKLDELESRLKSEEAFTKKVRDLG